MQIKGEFSVARSSFDGSAVAGKEGSFDRVRFDSRGAKGNFNSRIIKIFWVRYFVESNQQK